MAEMTFTQVIVSYFACVYYRRSVRYSIDLKYRESHHIRWFYRQIDFISDYFGWKRMALYVFVQVYTLTAQSAKLYFYYKTWRASEVRA